MGTTVRRSTIRRVCGLIACGMLLHGAAALSQGFPTKPPHLLVGFSGAGGNIAFKALIDCPADGPPLLLVTNPLAAEPFARAAGIKPD